MRITVVSDVLGEENNGTTIAAYNLIRFLKKRGHDVRVLCSDQTKKGEEGFFVVPNLNLGRPLNNYLKKVGVALSKPQREIVEASLDGVEHVHSILPFALGKMALEIAREKGISFTAGFHMQAENFTSHVKLNKLRAANQMVYKYVYNGFYKYVDGIHYPTQFIRDTFEEEIKERTNGYVISNGVHAYVKRRESVKPTEYQDKTVILSVGRYSREKSQDTLLKAVLYSKYKDKIQIILAGQGQKEKAYKKLAKKLPVPPVMKFFDREEMIDVLNYADIYAHPAEVELEGIACLEAIACGKLVVVSDSKLSATRNFAVDKRCVFENRNPEALAKVLDYWIENPEERAAIEQKYLDESVTFDQEECMKRMEEMMFEVVRAKKENS
ncbi:MAG: glycosyltransferase [Clostridia bacterium]|nr:glycosyltransferase [Clostridia bacterium]